MGLICSIPFVTNRLMNISHPILGHSKKPKTEHGWIRATELISAVESLATFYFYYLCDLEGDSLAQKKKKTREMAEWQK